MKQEQKPVQTDLSAGADRQGEKEMETKDRRFGVVELEVRCLPQQKNAGLGTACVKEIRSG